MRNHFKYFAKRMKDLLCLGKELIDIIFWGLESFKKEISNLRLLKILNSGFKLLGKEISNMLFFLINLPFVKHFHHFIPFGVNAVSNIFFSDKSSGFYIEKTKEANLILKEIEEFKKERRDFITTFKNKVTTSG